MKNYYAVLGVTSQAEDVVIKAAYRALHKGYHPDRNNSKVGNCHEKMAELNEAYRVLSSSELRAQYDKELQDERGGNDGLDDGEEAADEGVFQIDQDWSVAIDYYPDLVTIESRLERVSKSLAFMFKLYMIVEKDFSSREKIADRMENAFLCRYFGNQKPVIEFAKVLIDIGRRDTAKALNEAVRVLGGDLDPMLVINRIKSRFNLVGGSRCEGAPLHSIPNGKIFAGYQNDRAVKIASMAARSDAGVMDVRDAILALQGKVDFRGEGCVINVLGCAESFDKVSDALSWYKKFLYPKLYFKPNE